MDAEEIAHPEAGFGPAAVEGEDVVALLGKVVENQAAFVDFFRIDALLGGQLEVAIAGGDTEEGDNAFGLEDAECIGGYAVDFDILDVGDAEIAGLDVGVVGLGVKPLGDAAAVFQQRPGSAKMAVAKAFISCCSSEEWWLKRWAMRLRKGLRKKAVRVSSQPRPR